MKHVRIKEEKIANTTVHLFVLFPNIAVDKCKMLTEGKAFGVDHIDLCSLTGRNRIHLLDDNGFSTFAWVYEEYTEEI